MDKETFFKVKQTFQDNYFKCIKPNLDQFEEKRKKYLANANIVAPIFGALAVLYFFFYSSLGQESCNLNIVIGLGIVAATCHKYAQWLLNTEIKKVVMPGICKCFEDLSYRDSSYELLENYEQTGIVENYNISFVDDVLIGKYKNIDFEIIKTSLRKDYKNKGKSTLSLFADPNYSLYKSIKILFYILGFSAYLAAKTGIGQGNSKKVFNGVILKIKNAKTFTSHTLIKPDSKIKITNLNLSHTEFEDVVFEKKYDVYSNDPVDARYLITPAFMERINNVNDVFNAQKLSCAFYQNDIYIGIETKTELFSPCNIRKPVNDASGFVNLFQEIVCVYRLIEYLKLS